MYLRYRAKYFNEQSQKLEYGFFWAAEYLKTRDDLSVKDRADIERLVHWFDHNLPIPEYYQDKKNRQVAKSATSWYKDTSIGFIDRMNELGDILESYNVEVERISSKKLRGKQIYEDEYQVTIQPFKDVVKKTR